MKKINLLFALITIACISATAQEKFFTKTGKVSFYSKAALEDIEATNKSGTAILDSKTGNLQFAVLMKGFEFEKELMQDHFNESYVQSDKFPKAEFKGQVINNAAINYSRDGVYDAVVKGILTMHGASKEVESRGKMTVKAGKILTDANFKIQLSDYNISIPALVKDKISNAVEISVDCTLEPLKS